MIQLTQGMSDILKKAKQFITLVVLTSLALAGTPSVFAAAPVAGSGIFGQIKPPPGVDKFNANATATGGIGLISFFTVLIRVATIVAGLYVFINLITAGYDYISAGDAKAHQSVKDKFTMSILGLAIIVFSYTIIAVFSYIFFGNASFILSPVLTGPGP